MDSQTHITTICTGNKSGWSPWEAAAFHSGSETTAAVGDTVSSLCLSAGTIPDIKRVEFGPYGSPQLLRQPVTCVVKAMSIYRLLQKHVVLLDDCIISGVLN